MAEPNDDAWDALLVFAPDHPLFSRGFECGRLWVLAQSDADEIVEFAHASNAEMVLRIAEATGRQVRSEELGDGWLEVTFAERADA